MSGILRRQKSKNVDMVKVEEARELEKDSLCMSGDKEPDRLCRMHNISSVYSPLSVPSVPPPSLPFLHLFLSSISFSSSFTSSSSSTFASASAFPLKL